MTTSSITAASPLVPLATAGRLAPLAVTASAVGSDLGGDLGTADTSRLLDSVNALQSLAGMLGSSGSGMGAGSPTIPPYKPIEPIDQKTVRDSIPDSGDDASAASGA
jgi:hypothetical protein